jgi:hypothetical protein
VVATEDSDAPAQYFALLSLSCVKVLPTPKDTCLSAPQHVVARLKNEFKRLKGKVQTGDEFWVFIDTDHHFRPGHVTGTMEALLEARQANFEVAISNPSFELWLLLHHQEVPMGTVFSGGSEVEQKLREALGGSYNKSNLQPSQFPLERVREAVRRARALEADPDAPQSRWPTTTGTHVYRLLERALSSLW